MTATTLSTPLSYVETSIPGGMTLPQYRASRPRPTRRWRRLRDVLGLRAS